MFLLQAVQDYLHAEKELEQYGNLESFQGIRQDCFTTLEQLKEKLRQKFKEKEVGQNHRFLYTI